MQATNSQPRPTFDRSAAVAYGGVAAAIAFIGAMTMGMINGPSERNHLAAARPAGAMKVVSIAAPGGDEPSAVH